MNAWRKLFIFLSVLAPLLAAGGAWAAGSLSGAEFRRWQERQDRLYLVDVRGGQAFARKHIRGALNIPGFVLAKKGLPREETLVLYDSGIGSTEARDAARRLAEAGYAKVYLLEGGLARWEADGLPLDAPLGALPGKLVESVSVVELKQAVKDGLPMTLVDIRSAYLFKEGSLPGAQGVPAAQLAARFEGWRKDELVVLIDAGDNEAERQAELMRRAGFKMVRFLYGGYPEWKRQNAS